jgi:hypothetical protein
MRVAVRAVIIAVCLASLAFAGACGSKAAVTTSSTSAPAKKLSAQERYAAYLDALRPIIHADKRVWMKVKKVQTGLSTTNGFSLAARIDNDYLPAIQRLQARVAAITPPHGFREAHVRLKKALRAQYGFFHYIRDALNTAIYTHTMPADYSTRAHRRVARLKTTGHAFDAAVRAAAKRLKVRVPQRLAAAQGGRSFG